MHIAVVHDRISGNDAPDAVDVLAQADAVESALAVLGHTSIRLSCGLDLADLQRRLEASQAFMVLNLVESIDGKGRLIHLFPSLLDAMGFTYTGASAEAMMLTSNKVLAKKWMTSFRIPTPRWFTLNSPSGSSNSTSAVWIIKSVWEHASIGLDENSIVKDSNEAELNAALKMRSETSGGEWFAETFLEGREFNLSVLAGKDGPEVLPPAEIIFEGYTPDMPKIVDYRAKWDETAYSFHHTPRRFDFASDDFPLLESLKKLALACWKSFDLSGYARVDFRVDGEGMPWVLEVNANPCLSPDAGFAAALEQSGVSFEAALGRIIDDAKINN